MMITSPTLRLNEMNGKYKKDIYLYTACKVCKNFTLLWMQRRIVLSNVKFYLIRLAESNVKAYIRYYQKVALVCVSISSLSCLKCATLIYEFDR